MRRKYMRMVSSSQFHLVQALELHGAGMLCFSPVDTDFPDVFVLIRETFTASAHAANSEKYLNEKMLLKNLINKSVYGTIGYISSQDDLDLLEQYILYNLPVLKEFKKIIVATNYGSSFQSENTQLWKKYFPRCTLLDLKINRGHNFGTADLDNLVFDWCKENNEEWLCKGANDIIFQESILEKQIDEADFYYLNGISYETLYINNFDAQKLLEHYCYPQTNFYFINVSKCDYLNEKQYLDETYEYSRTIPNYNGKIWEYI